MSFNDIPASRVPKIKEWTGEALEGFWQVSRKIDGVRALKRDNQWFSRKGKPLYNIPLLMGYEDIEVYCGSWEETIEKVRSSKAIKEVQPWEMYSLVPLDERLNLGELKNPTKKIIDALMKSVIDEGYEGLILRQGDKWIKVKTEETIDLEITGIIQGEGKHKGRLGAFITSLGNVGTGFTDIQRTEFFTEKLIGETIEIEYQNKTPDGKLRHPRFMRLRYDK